MMPRNEYECSNCQTPLVGVPRQSLPVGNNADYVAVTDTTTEWGSVVACEMCYALHAAAGEHGPAVLAAYREHSPAMVDRVSGLLDALKEIAETTAEALHATR